MNEWLKIYSSYVWMSHITYEWVMSHMDESCHIWTIHITYERVMSHTNESCHIRMSHVVHEWGLSHMNEACQIWTSHVTLPLPLSVDRWGEWGMSHMPESCPLRVSHVTHKQVTNEWGRSRVMGWLRLVGSFKLQVSFAEYRLLYRALVQKRRIILRSLLIKATP